ncbi:S26 family signal peptidase [Streptomyces sp. NPDC048349]|uniref:S26 family signal peptidase n=1 Tax=Streptomyces sp. NPDC048349 TaxID=3155486 RepID=UPI0034134AF8
MSGRVLPGDPTPGRPDQPYGPELAAAGGEGSAAWAGPARPARAAARSRGRLAQAPAGVLPLALAGAGAAALVTGDAGIRTAAVAVLAAAALWWALSRRFVVVTVRGPSMEPAYRDGDRVLVRRGGPPRNGEVVVAGHPGAARRGEYGLLIKRVAAVPGDRIPRVGVPALARAPGSRVPDGRLVLLGDNRPVSLDSRELGYFPADRVLGRVLRHLPAHRTPSPAPLPTDGEE